MQNFNKQQKNMDCAICLEAAATPTKLGCGHAFHCDCLRQSGKFSKQPCPLCPLCRAPIEACAKGIEAAQRYPFSGVRMGDVALLKEAAAHGSAQCGLLLGQMYHMGVGVEKSDPLAEHFWGQFDNYSSACNNLAALAHRRGDAAKAEVFYRKAIAINPTAVYHVNLAELLDGSEEAIQNYYSAIALYSGDYANQAAVYMRMGRSVYARGHAHEAFAYFQQCLELTPNNINALNMAAVTCVDGEAAHGYTAAVLALDPHNADALNIKGRLYALQRNKVGADEMMRRLSAVAPGAKFTQELAESIRLQTGPTTRKRARG